MLDLVISYSFYALVFLVPLFWSSLNYELFEYNKMILTYALTVIIIGAWILKMLNQKSVNFKRSPLDIPLVLFLGANILATIFSMDVHTSIWGYYSRSNGGLLSLIAYLLLYWAFLANANKSMVCNLLKAALLSGFLISLWAIPEHFGVSFSCVVLRSEFTDACWIQDVQSRVFATLGQPNWLAVYLAMLIFPAWYFLLTAKNKLSWYLYYLLTIVLYLAFTFTYSRGPTLGLIGGLGVFLFFYIWQQRYQKNQSVQFRILGIICISFLLINILFGSALTSFRLVSKFASPIRPAIALPTAPSGTQLENGGTESGQIRFIVWQGALEIFKHHPILGSGLETFAYSYYQYRPASHNLTSEWDFLYNKAHNEYLNYLSTTGIIGFGTYMSVILVFVIWCVKKIIQYQRLPNKQGQLATILLILGLLGSYIAFLIYNFFLFSVVIIAVFFYLFPALAFITTDSAQPLLVPPVLLHLTNLIYLRKSYTRAAKVVVVFLIIFLLYSILKLWYADTLFARGEKAEDLGNAGRAYNYLLESSDLNPTEPFYRSELAFAAAQASTALKETDATLSAQLQQQAQNEMETVLIENPKNISYLRTAIRTYSELSLIDPKYIDLTLQSLDQAIALAPTDPKLYYNKGLVLDSINKKDEEVKILQKALELKPNYLEAQSQLSIATQSAKPKQ